MVRIWMQRLLGFLFFPESDKWLAILRVGLGLQVIAYTLSLRGDWNYLLAGNGGGLISRDLAETMLSLESPLIPRLGWLVTLGRHIGMTEASTLTVVWFCLLGAGLLLVAGFLCRPAAIAAWLLHLAAVKSGDLLSYGMDNFTTIGLFYLMLSPLPDHFSLDWRWRNPRARDPQMLGFWHRVLQVHLCLIYFFGGITKCLGAGWWDGSNIWRALIRPPFNVIPPEDLIRWKILFPFLGISVCLIETGYAFFIWGKRTGRIWLVCVLLMHIGIGMAMGMYLFSLIMIILNLAAFGVAQETISVSAVPASQNGFA
jgi:hypothetical protein